MMPIDYIAHRREQDGEVQPLECHLWQVGTFAAQNASKLAAPAVGGAEPETLGRVGELLGLLHDLGKYSKAFQDYLKSATGLIEQDADEYVDPEKHRGTIDHSTAGAQFLWKALGHDGVTGLVAQMLALCVASHHSGLIDCIGPNGEDNFTRRMGKQDGASHYSEAVAHADQALLQTITQLLDSGKVVGALIRQIHVCEQPYGLVPTVIQFKLGLLTRILFSCLIDADRVDTADFEKPHASQLRRSDQRTDWGPLVERLEKHLGELPTAGRIDPIRRAVSNHCRDAAERGRAIFSLTVPTGGGKTLASLRFALHHAKRHRLDRIIYVIPFTSIIDQNADVVRAILEPKDSGVAPGSVVLEHHSNLTPEEQTWRAKILSENWDAPVVFTTSVQLLETLFGAGTRGARRMHQLARSVVIFDEAQTLPVRCVHLFNNAINFLVEHCGSSVVLCTATQPLLNGVDPRKGSARFSGSNEIVPDPARLFAELRRTTIKPQRRLGGCTDAEIATLAHEEMEKVGSCLIIVNTRKTAKTLYEAGDAGVGGKKYHLSTDMCPAHRRAKLAEIRERLAAGHPTLCVSTQLIEAGVDIDFGAVIRHVAGLDSIAQAAGRCNRNGRRDTGNVHVVDPVDNNIDRLEDIRLGREAALQVLMDYDESPETFENDLLSPAAIKRYFELYFYKRSCDMDYPTPPEMTTRSDTLLRLLSDNGMSVDMYKQDPNHKTGPPLSLRQAFMTAAKAFKAIDAPTRGVIVPYGAEGKALIDGLRGPFDPKTQIGLLRRAQQFSVNVFPNVFGRLLQSGAVEEVAEDTGIYHLHPDYYSEEFGLSESPVPQEEAGNG